MAKFCISCGKEVVEGSNVCPNCGTPINSSPAPQAQPSQTVTTTTANQAQPKKSNGLAIAGFVISLVSMICCCGSLSLISLILSIIGAAKAKDCDGNGKGMAIAGIIISIVGIFILIIVSIFYSAAILSALEEAGTSY